MNVRQAGHSNEDEESSDELRAQLRDEEEEQAALARIILAFRDYQESAEWEIARWRSNWEQLPPRHKRLAPCQPVKLAAARQAVHTNMFVIKSLLQAFDPECVDGPLPAAMASALQASEARNGGDAGGAESSGAPAACGPGSGGRRGDTVMEPEEPRAGAAEGVGGPGKEAEWPGKQPALPRVSANDVDKVRYVLKNLARDWSSEGAAERMLSYGRILDEIKATFKDWSNPHRPPRVLIPGAGLARLCVDVASLGFEAQGNEFSYYMLLASSFILNHTAERHQYTIHPWIHSNCNHLTDADQLRPVAIPDVLPGEVVPGPGLLSMCAGDFVEVYSAPDMRGMFDCVATCFFIDTAHNVLRYLEVISHALAPGGTWINLGPLLYHWADAYTYLPNPEESVELSLEDIRNAAQAMGFRLIKEETLDVPYIADYRSMYKTVYQACFWTMIKEQEWEPTEEGAVGAGGSGSGAAVAPPPPPPRAAS